MGVLDDIIVGVREDLAERQAHRSLSDLMDAVAAMPPTRGVLEAFAAPGLSVIAEVKRSSPSKGALADIPDPAALAAEYAAGGAGAISVLTERRRFGGSLADLVAVRAAVDTPVLRKDFIVTEYQLWEARAAGADLALLMCSALGDPDLHRLHALALELGLTPLVEVHTPDEARRAVDLGAQLVGINNRNLQTLEVDIAQFENLVDLIPADRTRVAESGILSVADVERVAAAGADVILVGEALVRHGDPRASVAEFISAGSAAQRAQ
ncbi:indole-3-glycerol phosphate synthase TrpC [Propioniciclava sp. MC1595]|uniref:indole-3-glycerol phosphate synthase TrpC n=1 Tax=Propioniciclava sp. MC1595 TaxID=2760308 RepID=UPI0016622296|nr:indole-3-glycerol phosphate synthase TrpC [Propioniciclava sp. MC1595]MBB1495339.1 indole-3-glycerol phosphate synthase TrpC [Propioniciclava sp. MC1595]QTE24709.1 indole-3-glycerol phosphate synthase TrpC [Propioniciclava sp. MC1595]